MPAVLVHGVPEIPAVWDSLRSRLRRSDVVALALPGFGCPRPEGFGAGKDEYVAWVVAELEKLRHQGPLDLVGHDWGGAFVARIVSLRPDLVRTWVTDAAGVGHESFEWHEFAKVWQTPGAGEQFLARQLAEPVEARAGLFTQFGVAAEQANSIAAALDDTMVGCILALYRSAVDVGREWGADFRDIPAPGLVLVPSEDPFLAPESARAAAQASGADMVELTGLGHWWMLQDPARGAAMLENFWSATAPGASAPAET
jgi:pimeloyl-ACP methyl ester carboxylesterase